MLKYLLIGGGFAFAAVAQPGPLQAFLLSRVATGGWKRTLPAALAPVISDGPIALLVLLVLTRLPDGFEHVLRVAGGLLLLYFAGSTFMEWRGERTGAAREAPSAPLTLTQAVVVNLLNPNPYLGWSLVLGPMTLEAWRIWHGYAVTLLAAFYVTMVSCLALFILLIGTTSLLGPRGRRGLLLASSVVLAAIGAYQLVSAAI